jgi:RES domain-containing protein
VATAPELRVASYHGEAFRHMAARWDNPLSGEGARIHGGRFNPPDSFPVLYLCTTRPCAVTELRHLGARQVIGITGLLPRVLYRYQLDLDRILDLTSEATLTALGVSPMQITGADLSPTRVIGGLAHAMELQAIRAPSAAGVDEVLSVFPEFVETGSLTAELVERWEIPDDL